MDKPKNKPKNTPKNTPKKKSPKKSPKPIYVPPCRAFRYEVRVCSLID